MVKYKNENIFLKPKEKLLKYLIENKEAHSVLEVSGAVIMDYKNTYNLIKELSPVVISKEKIGNTSLVKLNLIPNLDISSTEEKRTEEFLLNNPKLRVLRKYILDLSYPFLIVLLFGSYVKKKNLENSDIDLCIICDNKEKSNELIKQLGIISLKLEIQEFTSEEFISMTEKKHNNLGHEIVKNNIILYGVENYYHLISKWTKIE